MAGQNVTLGGGRGSVIEKSGERQKSRLGTPKKESSQSGATSGFRSTEGKDKSYSANSSTSSKEDIIIRWNHNVLTTKQSWTYNLRLTMLSSKDNLICTETHFLLTKN